MIKADFTYGGFKVRSFRDKTAYTVDCSDPHMEIVTDFVWEWVTVAWNDQGQFYRGDPLPMRAESQAAAVAAIDVMNRVA